MAEDGRAGSKPKRVVDIIDDFIVRELGFEAVRLDAVGDGSDPVDLADDLVAVLAPQRRLTEAADAARRAGEDQVARLERHLRRRGCDVGARCAREHA